MALTDTFCSLIRTSSLSNATFYPPPRSPHPSPCLSPCSSLRSPPAESFIQRRHLRSRHISFIGLGGGIGVGLFVGVGAGLQTAGPLGLLLAFAIMGAIMWGVLQGAAEMATLVPTAGGFPHFVARFVDPAAGFAVGWTCEYQWANRTSGSGGNRGREDREDGVDLRVPRCYRVGKLGRRQLVPGGRKGHGPSTPSYVDRA